MRPSVSLLVTDVDNTLFDWLAMWHAAFSAMLNEIVHISGLPAERLEPEIRAVFQRHGTVEYSFLIEELPSLAVDGSTRQAVRAKYEPAVAAYRREAQAALRPYPGVVETLLTARSSGCQIVAY